MSLQIVDLAFAYHSKAIFADLTLSLEPGTVLIIIGPSGGGKSTLLKILAGILRPTRGSMNWSRAAVGSIAWVPQDIGLFPWLTIKQNIAFPLRLKNRRDWTEVAMDIAGQLALLDVAEQLPQHVSGGQKQRAAVGRALAAEAQLLLMDEPFSALDQPTRAEIRDLIRAQTKQNGLITVIATHDLLDAAYICDAALFIGGKGARPELAFHRGTAEGRPRTSAEAAPIAALLADFLVDRARKCVPHQMRQPN